MPVSDTLVARATPAALAVELQVGGGVGNRQGCAGCQDKAVQTRQRCGLCRGHRVRRSGQQHAGCFGDPSRVGACQQRGRDVRHDEGGTGADREAGEADKLAACAALTELARPISETLVAVVRALALPADSRFVRSIGDLQGCRGGQGKVVEADQSGCLGRGDSVGPGQ